MKRRLHFKFIAYLFVTLTVFSAHANTLVDFFRAVHLDDARTVQRLLDEGLDPNSLNDKGQPCGTQRVTLRNVSKLIEAGNAVIRKSWEVQMKDKDTAAERELINASLARPEPFLSLTGQQIRIRSPFPRADFDQLGKDDEKFRHFLAEFIRLGGAMSHENGEVHVRFGRTDATRETVTLPMLGKGYQANAVGHIRDTYSFTKDFDPKQEAEEFLRAKTAERKK